MFFSRWEVSVLPDGTLRNSPKSAHDLRHSTADDLDDMFCFDEYPYIEGILR